MHSIFDNVLSKVTVRPQATDTAVEGGAIDTQGFSSAMAVVENGAATGTPSSYTVDGKVQTSADGSTGWADITGATITQMTANNKSAQIRVDGLNLGTNYRYIRLLITAAMTGGSSPKAVVSGHILLGRGESLPVGNSSVGA